MCGEETEVVPEYGTEVVSVHCLKHTSGVRGHVHPIYMLAVPAPGSGAGAALAEVGELVGSARS